jgi:CheY-like chemotaxis protein
VAFRENESILRCSEGPALVRDIQRTGRILVVEDELLIGEDLSHLLQTSGYEVIGVACSAREAVQMATERQPDLILMDVRIRGDQDGIEAHRLVEEAIGREVPVIFLTASRDADNRAALRSIVVPKPYLETELLGSIQQFLPLLKGRPN